MAGFQFVEGDLVRIKDTQRNDYTSIYMNDVSFMITKLNDNGTVHLDTIEESVSYKHIEPIKINGKDDINIYYNPSAAASGVRHRGHGQFLREGGPVLQIPHAEPLGQHGRQH